MKKFLVSLAALAVAACASDQSQKPQASASSPKEGELSAVGVIPTTLLHDAQRNKDVDVSIEYPVHETGGPYPVIIISHTYGTSNRIYESLAANWTGHGYVVIRPAHADANALRETPREAVPPQPQDRDGRGRRGEQRANPKQPVVFRAPLDEQIWDKQREPQWRDRARDVSFIIDSLPGLEEKFPELKGKLDRSKIGVAGHAYGAFTALLLAGMKPDDLQLTDSRVTAVMAMSPEGVSATRDLTAESFHNIKIPVLFMTGTSDFGATEQETPDWRKTAYENSPAGDKYWVFLNGARHGSFTGLASVYESINPSPMRIPLGRNPMTGQEVYGEEQTRGATTYFPDRILLERIRTIGLSFFDAYLKNDAKAKESIVSDKLGNSVTVEKK